MKLIHTTAWNSNSTLLLSKMHDLNWQQISQNISKDLKNPSWFTYKNMTSKKRKSFSVQKRIKYTNEDFFFFLQLPPSNNNMYYAAQGLSITWYQCLFQSLIRIKQLRGVRIKHAVSCLLTGSRWGNIQASHTYQSQMRTLMRFRQDSFLVSIRSSGSP